MMEDQGSKTFKIPEENFKKFEAAIAKFSRKAQKLCGESITPVVYGYEMQDIGGGEQIKVYEVLLDCIVPKLNGWSFLARIDHNNGEIGNIVRPMPGKTLDEKYRTVSSVCEHCNVKRYRRDTFVIQHEESGDVKQVGSTCLKDFLGHASSEKIAKLAELLGYAAECARGHENFVGGARRYINLELYLAHVAKCVRERGFVARSVAKREGIESTSDIALTHMNAIPRYYEKPEESDFDLAQQSIEWAQELGEDGTLLNDYQHNIKVIAASGCCEFRSTGFAASIINGYMREQASRQPQHPKVVSAHVGQIGEKLDFVATLTLVREIETQYGFTYLHSFVTAEGNVMKTFTNKALGKVNETYKARGIVKVHDEYKGSKQTTLSRVKVDKL
jgi:hypothetical protein